MSTKKKGKHHRVYRRENGRWYADLRSYADVLDGKSGRHLALVAPGERLATTDRDVALTLAARLVEELEARRRGLVLVGRSRDATLGEFAGKYLVLKKRDGRVSDKVLEWAERVGLPRALKHFGASRPLQSIDVAAVRAWAEWLGRQQGARKKPLSSQTIRHHLNLLSNLYGYAQQEGIVAPGTNPVRLLMVKPRGEPREAQWLEVPEAGRFLEAAERVAPDLYPALATLLLTGGRKSEVLGLELRDVDLDRRVVRFRPNGWRRLKTKSAIRTVPLWPQLEAILRPHVAERTAATGDPSALLFPTFSMEGSGAGARRRLDRETMITDMRRALDRVAREARLDPRRVHLHAFRHTYCAARLQTLDGGKPVSTYTVACELGHSSEAMVRQVYGHLGEVRERGEVVAYFENCPEVQYGAA